MQVGRRLRNPKMAGTRKMKRFVIDTSVAVKWFSQGEDNNKNALLLRQQMFEKRCTVLAPDLMIYELANALRFNPHFSAEDVRAAINSLLDMGITFKEAGRNVISQAINLAYKYKLTVYDACFLALTQTEKTSLLTADTKFLEKIKSLGNIILLSEFTEK